MQWLIDLVLDKIRLDGLAVYRGDPANHDFEFGDFTLDATWHTLDLSSIIPEHTTVVYCYAALRAIGVNQFLFFRTKGQTETKNKSSIRTQVSNVLIEADLVVFPDEDGCIEYEGPDTNINLIRLTVKGWDF